MLKIINKFGQTDIGEREENQDSFLFFNNKYGNLISIIADGMGGHIGGVEAAKIATYFSKKELNKIAFDELSHRKIQEKLIDFIKKMRLYFDEYAKNHPKFQDMGTTLNLNIFTNDEVFTLNIGDSRTTNITKKNTKIITIDHNLDHLAKTDQKYSELIGLSNFLTSSIGPKKETKLDLFSTKLKKEGYIVQTCDGIHNFVTPLEIKKIIFNKKFTNLTQKTQQIITKAKQEGSKDNLTIILIQYKQNEYK